MDDPFLPNTEPVYHRAEVMSPPIEITDKDLAIAPESPEQEIKKSNLNISNFILSKLSEAWDRENLSTDEIVKLSLTTMKVIESRNELFAPKEKKGRKGFFEAF